MKEYLRSLFRMAGYEVVNIRRPEGTKAFPEDFSQEEIRICLRVRAFTQTPAENVVSLIRAVEYVASSEVPGAIVECGVWKGGSMMAAASALLSLGRRDRDLFLFDTYAGMPEPTEADDPRVHAHWAQDRRADRNDWNYAPLETVRANLLSTGYPEERLHFVKGRVEDRGRAKIILQF